MTFLLIVTAEVDASVEAEWNHWYDTVHLPDALKCPGVISGRRYRSRGDVGTSGRGTRTTSADPVYTTIYEITGPDAVKTPEFQAMRGWYQFTPHVRSRTQVVEALTPAA
jgi:hypothetical protein